MFCKRLLLIAGLFLTACGATTPTASPGSITVEYTFAAAPFLATLDNCAGSNAVNEDLRSADYLEYPTVDLAIRIGQPEDLPYPAYQIGTEDILVIANRQNPVSSLTGKQVRDLFTGQIQNWKELEGADAPVQVWVFPAGDDIQQIFDQNALGGSPFTSMARLANSPDEMSLAIANDVNAVGILSRHWKAGNVSDVYTISNIPVLAITPAQPSAILAGIIACLKNR